MKKYIYKVLSVGVFASLALSSCTDLTEPVYDSIPADQFLKTDAQIAAALGPAYGGLRGITWDWFNPSEASSDELIVPTRGGDWYDGGDWLAYSRHTWTPQHGPINGMWGFIFGNISQINQLIPVVKTNQKAVDELRAVRAIYYFMAVDAFGNVPIVTDNKSSAATKTRAEVYNFIVSELTSAIPNLPAGKAYSRMTQDAAKAMGAMALFGEKYGDQVRVVSIGDWAKELCGGTHVTRSGQLGLVKLLSESSIGAGVRRIEALVGHDAYQFLAREHVLLNSLTEIIKGVRAEELPQRISELVEKMKIMEKELAVVRSAKAMASAAELVKKAKLMGQVNLLTAQLENEVSVDDLRSIAIDLRGKLKGGVVVLATINNSKPMLVAAVSPEAIKLGVKAGELIKIGSTVLGGGGGGKDDFAQGGGTEPKLIDQAFAEITKVTTGKIS
mgnify:CR=1 FL=1